MHVVEVLRLSALFTGALIMMLMINVWYALIAISLAPVILAGSLYFFKRESKVWKQHEKEQDKLTTIVQENISGIRVVKAFSKEKYEINKFTEQNRTKLGWGLKLNNLHKAYWPLSDVVVHLQVAVSIFAGGYFVLNNTLSVGEYVAFYSYAMMVTWPMRRIGQLTSEMGMTSVAIERLYSILNSPAEDESGNDFGEQAVKGKIEFRNVSFRYNEKERNVLDNVSFTINQGEKIALLGPTGSGKSTIISLLERFYDPREGDIFIDDMDLKNISRKYIRNRVGVVLQNPFLFSTSVKENIAYGIDDFEFEDVTNSAKIAKIHNIIESSFPESYDTLVGEKGVTLSGGQKQRLTIARTIISDPDILVLDDCTSSVDTETEYEIQKALQKRIKNKTTIIIAHRITSIQDCDRIIVLEKGKIIESGTHTELLKNDSFYKKIYDIQISIEDEIEKDMKKNEMKPVRESEIKLHSRKKEIIN
jgi:ATP-binding cassette subfamily B protein